MTVKEFNDLSEEVRLYVLADNGEGLMFRRVRTSVSIVELHILYTVDGLFVEMVWNTNNGKIISVRALEYEEMDEFVGNIVIL